MSNDRLIEWGIPGDGQMSRLGHLMLVILTIAGCWFLLATEREPRAEAPVVTIEQHPVTPFCSDDEVLVRVERDGFEFHDGQLVCVHIDNWRTPT